MKISVLGIHKYFRQDLLRSPKVSDTFAFLSLFVLMIGLLYYRFLAAPGLPGWWDGSDYLLLAQNIFLRSGSSLTAFLSELFWTRHWKGNAVANLGALLFLILGNRPLPVIFTVGAISELLSMISIWRIFNFMMQNRKSATLATAVLISTPFFWQTTFQFMTELPYISLLITALYYFLILRRHWQPSTAVFFSLCMGAASIFRIFETCFFMFWFLFFSGHLQNRRWRELAFITVPGLIILLTWHLSSWQETYNWFILGATSDEVKQTMNGLTSWDLVYLHFRFYFSTVFSAIFLITVFRIVIEFYKENAIVLEADDLILFVPAAVFYALRVFVQNSNPRFCFAASIYIWILGLTTFARFSGKRLFTTVISVAIALNLLVQFDIYRRNSIYVFKREITELLGWDEMGSMLPDGDFSLHLKDDVFQAIDLTNHPETKENDHATVLTLTVAEGDSYYINRDSYWINLQIEANTRNSRPIQFEHFKNQIAHDSDLKNPLGINTDLALYTHVLAGPIKLNCRGKASLPITEEAIHRFLNPEKSRLHFKLMQTISTPFHQNYCQDSFFLYARD